MFNAFSGFFTGIFKVITIASIAVFAPFVAVSAFFLLFYFIKGKRIKKRTVKRKKAVYSRKQSILKRLYIDFPRRLIFTNGIPMLLILSECISSPVNRAAVKALRLCIL